MARLFLGSVLALSLAIPAFAGCEDGEAMATAAAKTEARKAGIAGCKLSQISDPIDTKAGQDFRVTLRCGRSTPTYHVRLREIEDAVCKVLSVKRVNLSAAPHYTCPRGMMLNCTPPVINNPMCDHDWKAWIRSNCPGVRFIE